VISPEQRRAYENGRYARDPEYRAKKQERARQRYAEKREEIKAQSAARYRQDPERQAEYGRSWAERNPERARASRQANNARRRQRRRGGDFTGAQWLEILEEFDHCCAYCQARPEQLEQEHVTPLSRGGQHTKGNIVPACRDCNRQKGARTLFEFAALAA
jgi:5-methylcytosine-specific restriction endonuclease McrA